MPTHPTHSMPVHSMPAHSMPVHSMPAHSMPAHSMPAHSMPTYSVPTPGLPAHGPSGNHSLSSAHWDRRPIFTKRVGQRRASSLYPQAGSRPPLKPAVTPDGRPIVTFESESEEIQPSCSLSCRPATPKGRPPNRPPAPPRTEHPTRQSLCCDCGVRVQEPPRWEFTPQTERREAYTASVPAPLDRLPVAASVAAPVAPVATYYRAPPEYVHTPPTYHRDPAAYHREEFRGPRRQSSAESAPMGNGRRRMESLSPEPWSPEPRWAPTNEFPRRQLETQTWQPRPLIEGGHTRAGFEGQPTELVTRRIIHRPGPWVEEQPMTYGYSSVQPNLESYSPSLHRHGVVDMAESSQELPLEARAPPREVRAPPREVRAPLREIRTQPVPRDEPPPIAVLSPETESVDRPVTSGNANALKLPKRTAKPAGKNAPASRPPTRTPREEPSERLTDRKRQAEPRERQSDSRERQAEPRARQAEPRERQAEPRERQEYRVETGNHSFKVVRL